MSFGRKRKILQVLVIGENRAGKTQLINRILNRKFSKNYEQTQVIEYSKGWEEEDGVAVRFADLPCELNEPISKNTYKNTKILIFVADVKKDFAHNVELIRNCFAANNEQFSTAKVLLVFTKDDDVTSKLTAGQLLDLKTAANIEPAQVLFCSARNKRKKDPRIADVRSKIQACVKVISQEAIVREEKHEGGRINNVEYLQKNPLEDLKEKLRVHIRKVDNPGNGLEGIVSLAKSTVLNTALNFLEEEKTEHEVCEAIVSYPAYSNSTGRSHTKKLVKLALDFKKLPVEEKIEDANIKNLLKDISAQRRKITFAYFGGIDTKLAKLKALQLCENALMDLNAGHDVNAADKMRLVRNIKDFDKAMLWSNTLTLVNKVDALVKDRNPRVAPALHGSINNDNL